MQVRYYDLGRGTFEMGEVVLRVTLSLEISAHSA